MTNLTILLVLVANATIIYGYGLRILPQRSYKVGKVGSRVHSSIQPLLMSSNNAEEDDKYEKALGVEETTKKYGLEAGLFKSITNPDGSEVKPGQLLKKYGAAYLITSITLAIISYGICYFLVNAGVDVASLLKRVGIEVSSTATNAGTAGIAYVIHKAASPIRFPPTVALTPVIANIIGKKPDGDAT